MAILRKERRAHYTVIDNSIFFNYDLSYKAKGLLCQMLSLPDGWEFSVEGLTRLSTDGKSAITSAMNELEEAGYFRREQVRVGGKIQGVEYIISETPFSDFPISENPTSGNPISENQPQYITNISNTDISNTKDIDIGYSHKNGKRTRFTPPTVEEVAQYINEQGLHIDAETFIDYYNSNGWKVGRTPMKDYKATLRNWERRRQENEGVKTKTKTNPFMEMLKNGDNL